MSQSARLENLKLQIPTLHIPAQVAILAIVVLLSHQSVQAEKNEGQAKAKIQNQLVSRISNEEKIEAAVNSVTELEFVDNPLVDAFRFISDLHDINIVLDRKAMEDVGVALDEPINLALSGVSLKSALRIMLRPLGLDYVIEDEVLKITSEEVAVSTLKLRVYDLRQLENSGFELDRLAEVVRKTIAPETWAAVNRKPASLAGVPVKVLEGKKVFQRVIKSSSGGSQVYTLKSSGSAAIEALPGCLVVSQTRRIHAQIEELIGQLEKIAPRKLEPIPSGKLEPLPKY